jgi:hypothetical protein
MPVWVVANAFKSQAMKAIKAAGGGKTGLDKVRKSNPNWFTYKTKAGSTPAKAKPKAKATTAAKKGKGGFSEAQLAKYRDVYKNRKKDKRWDSLPQDVKDRLLK